MPDMTAMACAVTTMLLETSLTQQQVFESLRPCLQSCPPGAEEELFKIITVTMRGFARSLSAEFVAHDDPLEILAALRRRIASAVHATD